jgi:hypothetical protein
LRPEIPLFARSGSFDGLRINPFDRLRTSSNPPKADFSWRLNLLLGSKSRNLEIQKRCNYNKLILFNFFN